MKRVYDHFAIKLVLLWGYILALVNEFRFYWSSRGYRQRGALAHSAVREVPALPFLYHSHLTSSCSDVIISSFLVCSGFYSCDICINSHHNFH